MEKWPNRTWRFLSYTQLLLWFVSCKASPITNDQQELHSPVEALAPYTENLGSKAPWKSNLPTYYDVPLDSSIAAPQERANSQRCGSNMLDLKIGDSGLIQSPNYP